MSRYAIAEARLAGGRYKTYRPVATSTWLVRIDDDTIGVRLHDTFVVVLHRDGRQVINQGGWNTPTTHKRISEWSTVRYYSTKNGRGIAHDTDPISPPKVQGCRTCHKVGKTYSVCVPGWCYGAHYLGDGTCVHGFTEGHRKDACHHGNTEAHREESQCYRCNGAGVRDYGSNRISTPWDGSSIECDATGKVIGPPAKTYSVHAYPITKPASHISGGGWNNAGGSFTPPSNGYVSGDTITAELTDLFPDMENDATCPVCQRVKSYIQTVIHLNDLHHWSREDIADWLEARDIDIRFPIPA